MDTPEILASKSRELLNEQLSSVDANNAKAGTIITISALFVPISFSVFDKFAIETFWILVFFIPIFINLTGIFFLVLAMYPRKLHHGMNFTEIIKHKDKDSETVYLFEIGINRDSYNFNSKPVALQNRNIRKGIITIFGSVIALTLIFLVNLATIKNKNMSDNTPNTSPSTGNSNANTGPGNSSDSGRQIPSTDAGQRSTIEKGGNPAGTPLKHK